MPDRASVNRLSAAQRRAVTEAIRELDAFFTAAARAGWDPTRIRAALLEVFPALCQQYGDVVATAAAEWYEQTRAAEIGGTYEAVLAEPVPLARLEGSVRAAAHYVYTGELDLARTMLLGSLQRYVMDQGRGTITRNAARDKACHKWARVPSGPSTCAWCAMLASRGWVYASAESAGGDGNRYHDHCDCQIVPSWKAKDPSIAGYDPDGLKAKYDEARRIVVSSGQSPTAENIAAAMRKRYPGEFTDSPKTPAGKAGAATARRSASLDNTLQREAWDKHRAWVADRLAASGMAQSASRRLPPEALPSAPQSWPDDLPALTAKAWAHTLYGDRRGGGHGTGYGWIHGSSEFPSSWTPNDILRAAEQVLRSQAWPTSPAGIVEDTVNGIRVRVALRTNKRGVTRVASIIPVHNNAAGA
ncbi:EndoU domain-containing protein [Actinomyces procaprae]|uniref:VG15 protein n=1 Tax=Actinomyces procaprae TaxID=2560010 RepID=UPI00109DD0B7|nr:EndoU domain-containing protein [Actinomyces procaprae]